MRDSSGGPLTWRHAQAQPAVLGTLYVGAALIGHVQERRGAITCECREDCWCKRPGLIIWNLSGKWEAGARKLPYLNPQTSEFSLPSHRRSNAEGASNGALGLSLEQRHEGAGDGALIYVPKAA